MVTQGTLDGTAATQTPERFRAGESRNRRLGRPLRLLGRVDAVDEALLDRIGAALMRRDEPGAAVAAAMSAPKGSPDRVTMRQIEIAVREGVDAVEDCPEALREFFALVDDTPDWVDFDLIEAGATAYRRYGWNVSDVMTQLALINGYRFGGPTDLLVETGGLTGSTALRRLAETQQWAIAVSEPGGMRRDGEGFALTVHVRLMHALVNHRFENNGRWDVEKWGLPINQADQASTLGLFNATLLIGLRALGVRVTRDESHAIMHLWRYVGWLMGVDEEWLVTTERRQNHLNYHLLLTQNPVTEAGPQLANAIVDAQRRLTFPQLPLPGIADSAALRGRHAQWRLLSMLRFFLGSRGMVDLELRPTLPTAVIPVIAANVVRFHVVDRLPGGRAHLQRWGENARTEIMRRYFGGEDRSLPALHG